MEVKKLLDLLHTVEKLKSEARHCVTADGQPETVAAHSWRIALMALLMRDEYPALDMDKVIRMCLIHDLGECFLGDIPVFAKNTSHEQQERETLLRWFSTLPAPYDTELRELYLEMDALETDEAKLYKSLDKLEAVIQHNEAPIDTWEDHEYDLQRTYAMDFSTWSPYIKELRGAILEETEQKIEDAKNA